MLEIQSFTLLNGVLEPVGAPFTMALPTVEAYAGLLLKHGYASGFRREDLEALLGDGCPYELWQFDLEEVGRNNDKCRGVRISYRGVRVLKAADQLRYPELAGAAK